jgi:hypothetical protein
MACEQSSADGLQCLALPATINRINTRPSMDPHAKWLKAKSHTAHSWFKPLGASPRRIAIVMLVPASVAPWTLPRS